MPIAIPPRIAQTITITANMIIPFGNPFDGSFTLFTRGDLLASADCEYKDRKGCEVVHVELRIRPFTV